MNFTLFPRIKYYESRPWWAGIAAEDNTTREYILAPLGLNWLVAAGLVAIHCVASPSFLVSVFVHREKIVRVAALNRENYRLTLTLGDLKVQNRVLSDRVKYLEGIVADTIHEKRPQSGLGA